MKNYNVNMKNFFRSLHILLCFSTLPAYAGSELRSGTVTPQLSCNLFIRFNLIALDYLNSQEIAIAVHSFSELLHTIENLPQDTFDELQSKIKKYVLRFRLLNDGKRSCYNCWHFWKRKMRPQLNKKPLSANVLEKHFQKALKTIPNIADFSDIQNANFIGKSFLRKDMDKAVACFRTELLEMLFDQNSEARLPSHFTSISDLKKIVEQKQKQSDVEALVYRHFWQNPVYRGSRNYRVFLNGAFKSDCLRSKKIATIESQFPRALLKEEFQDILKENPAKTLDEKSKFYWIFHAFHWGRGIDLDKEVSEEELDLQSKKGVNSEKNVKNDIKKASLNKTILQDAQMEEEDSEEIEEGSQIDLEESIELSKSQNRKRKARLSLSELSEDNRSVSHWVQQSSMPHSVVSQFPPIFFSSAQRMKELFGFEDVQSIGESESLNNALMIQQEKQPVVGPVSFDLASKSSFQSQCINQKLE